MNSEKVRDGQFVSLDRITFSEADKFHLDGAKLQTCVKDQNDQPVTASVEEGESLGVSGTPTIFVNGEMLNGARSVDEMRAALDRALERAECPLLAMVHQLRRALRSQHPV